MRIAIMLGALAGAAMFTSGPSPATAGAWCLQSDTLDCGQPSYDMCRFAGSPESGYCYPNLRHRRSARPYEAMAHHAYWGPPARDSWWGAPMAYAPHRAPFARDAWAWSAPAAPHWTHHDRDVENFWQGYQPVMLRMPPSGGTQDRWCLTIKYTTCSIPSYDVCRFAASPENGYCFPNPNYWEARHSLYHMARAHRHRHDGHMALAARASVPGVKLAASRAAAAQASVGVEAAPAVDSDSALAAIVARTKEIDGAYGAFAMAGDTTATAAVVAPSNRLPAVVKASSGREQVKVASLAPDSNAAAETLAPATPAVVPRKGAAGGGVPTINVMASCRAAGNAILGVKPDVEICLKSEASARDQLAQQWAEFLPAERASCIGLTTMGGGGTYTELLTCLELRQFARNMHKDDPVARIAGR